MLDNVTRMFAYFFPFVVAKNGGLWFPGDLQSILTLTAYSVVFSSNDAVKV